MRAPIRVRYNGPKGTSTPPREETKSRSLTTVRQQRATRFGMTEIARQTLIGNDMHSPASATALKCATSIFLIGNEFRLQDASFRSSFAQQRKRRRAAALQRGTPGCVGRGRGKQRPYERAKSRFLVVWLLRSPKPQGGRNDNRGSGGSPATARQKPHVSSRKTGANGT